MTWTFTPNTAQALVRGVAAAFRQRCAELKGFLPAIPTSSPYGWTKLMIARILTDYATAHPDFCAILLQYFTPLALTNPACWETITTVFPTI